MHGGGHNTSAPRSMQRTKEKQPSQKMINEALAAEATTLPPPPAPTEAPAQAEAVTGEELEARHHAKVSIEQRRAERAERAKEAGRQDDHSGSDSDESDVSEVKEFHYTRPKPRVLTDTLFMWEHVAAFSAPTQVPELERVSRDVAAHLKESNKGARVMQRYWNAQWCRMVWKEEELPQEKRFLPTTMLSHSEAKRRWKKVFVEEYPFYLNRTYQRSGVRNNDVNEAKVLFHVETLNPNRTAAELQRMELTEDEARVKEQRKRGVEVDFEHVDENGAGASGDGAAGGVRPGLEETKRDHAAKEKGRPRAVQKDSYTRADYKEDFRTGARKGKHQKGGTNRWDNFDSYGDYDY